MIDFNPRHRETEYERTKNPLMAWDMILECSKEKTPFPDWVMNYLQDTAEELVNLSPPKGKMPVQIRDALGFREKTKPFDKYKEFLSRKSKADFEFKLAVYNFVESRNADSKTEAYEEAGAIFFRNNGDPDNRWKRVQRIYLEMVKAFEEINEIKRRL